MAGPSDTQHHDAWDELVAAGRMRSPDASVVRDAVAAIRTAAAQEHHSESVGPDRKQRLWSPRLAMAAMASLAVVVVGAVAWTLLGASGAGDPETPLVQVPGTSEPTATAGLPGTASPPATSAGTPGETVVQGVGPVLDDEMASCAFDYNAETLADRSFAFEGVVIAIGSQGGTGFPMQDTVVTFSVTHWYKGGSGAEVSLDVWGPGGGTASTDSDYGATYSIGTRLLVSGEPRWGGEPLDDAVAWPCGFTRYYDEATAAFWTAAFE